MNKLAPLATLTDWADYCGCDPQWFADYIRQRLPDIPADLHASFDWTSEFNQLVVDLMDRPLAAFHLANFKAYGAQPQRFPIAPITLLFGPNSAGKSSLLQAMLYVQHAIENGELSPRYLKGAGTTVDLGRWADWMHSKNEDAVVQFGFEFDHLRRVPGPDSPPTLWWVALRHGRIASATLHHAGRELLHFIPDSNKRDRLRCVRAHTSGPFFQEIAVENPLHREWWLKPWAEWPESEKDAAGKAMSAVLEKSELAMQGLVPTDFSAATTPPENSTQFEARLAHECEKAVARFLSQAAGTVKRYFQGLDFLSSQRIAPGRDLENLDKSSLNYWHNGGAQWQRLAEYEDDRDELNRWYARLHGGNAKPRGLPWLEFASVNDFNALEVESTIERITHDYLMERYNAHEEDRSNAINDRLPESDRQAAQERFAFPFDRIDATEITKQIIEDLARNRRAVANRHLVIRDKSKRAAITVSPVEIGVGPQYLVPVLVQTMEGGGRVKIIEEPELHLHPAMQVEFADFAIRHAFRDGSSGNKHDQTLIFETHSEHIVLRMLRRVRESSEGNADYPVDYIPKIRPDQIAVVYTEPKLDGTILHHLKITDDGDFIDPWPVGFFTERADELFLTLAAMWKEYAIEPACLVQSAETFRSIRALFGTEQGRWVAKYPGRWKELVKAVLRESQLREIERTRVVEWLSQDRGRFVGLYGNLSYQESLSWLDNALAHHRARPFAGLIASSLGGHDSAAIVPNEGEDISSHLPSPHQITVARTPQAISAAAIPLLRRSQAILFVDPNCGFEERFMAVLREMLRVVDARPQRPLRIEYHFRHDPERALDTSRIGHGLPAGADIVLFAWREREGDEGMHDRFILGEDYGLEFSYGLDRGELGQTTGVTRMAKDRHAKFWRAYQRTTATFDLATGFPVTVSRA